MLAPDIRPDDPILIGKVAPSSAGGHGPARRARAMAADGAPRCRPSGRSRRDRADTELNCGPPCKGSGTPDEREPYIEASLGWLRSSLPELIQTPWRADIAESGPRTPAASPTPSAPPRYEQRMDPRLWTIPALCLLQRAFEATGHRPRREMADPPTRRLAERPDQSRRPPARIRGEQFRHRPSAVPRASLVRAPARRRYRRRSATARRGRARSVGPAVRHAHRTRPDHDRGLHGQGSRLPDAEGHVIRARAERDAPRRSTACLSAHGAPDPGAAGSGGDLMLGPMDAAYAAPRTPCGAPANAACCLRALLSSSTLRRLSCHRETKRTTSRRPGEAPHRHAPHVSGRPRTPIPGGAGMSA